MSIDERLERLVAVAEVHSQQIGAHSQQMSELREANALLVQLLSQE